MCVDRTSAERASILDEIAARLNGNPQTVTRASHNSDPESFGTHAAPDSQQPGGRLTAAVSIQSSANKGSEPGDEGALDAEYPDSKNREGSHDYDFDFVAQDVNNRRSVEVDFSWFGMLALERVRDFDEVVVLMKKVEVGLFAQERLAKLGDAIEGRYRRELKQIKAEGVRSFEQLVRSNMRLVFYWSKGIARTLGNSYAQDAFQAGCMGLVRGLQGWDYRQGYALSTYVSWHIRQSIQRWRATDTLDIRLPVHVWESLPKLKRDGKPYPAAVVRALGMGSFDDIKKSRPSESYEIDEIEEANDRRVLTRAVLDLLGDRPKEVLAWRHGLVDGEPRTLDEIGALFGVTRERIRQIESKAIKTIHSRLGASGRLI